VQGLKAESEKTMKYQIGYDANGGPYEDRRTYPTFELALTAWRQYRALGIRAWIREIA
jgi:hypothetical protein